MEIGMSFTAEKIVENADSAAVLGSGNLAVFATPSMILLMELAARQAVQGVLGDANTTVGTLVNVRHMAATPVGARVCATARLTEIDGRRLVFEVEASDENGIIGKGLHERAVVDIARFMAKVAK